MDAVNIYEYLQDEACKNGIDIIDYEFMNQRIKRLYCDNSIGINKNIKTVSMYQRSCYIRPQA